MRAGERIFELILSVAIGIFLWNLIVIGAGRGVFVDVSGRPLGATAASGDLRGDGAEQQPIVRLGASRRDDAHSIGVDRAVFRLVMQR